MHMTTNISYITTTVIKNVTVLITITSMMLVTGTLHNIITKIDNHVPKINIRWTNYFIHNAYLPPVTIGIGVTIKPLEVNKKIVERCVLLINIYGHLDSVST